MNNKVVNKQIPLETIVKVANHLEDYKENCKELKELKPLYQELIIIWRERAYITPNNNEELLKENDIKFNDVLERIKDVESDVEAKWKVDNPFHSTRENKNGSVFNVITIEIETETEKEEWKCKKS